MSASKRTKRVAPPKSPPPGYAVRLKCMNGCWVIPVEVDLGAIIVVVLEPGDEPEEFTVTKKRFSLNDYLALGSRTLVETPEPRR